MKGNSRHIEALTSLRFFAALLVVVFHHGQAALAGAPSWLMNVIKGGYAGVPFFFILSGFILAYNYGPQVEEQTFAARRFWLARFARIYPAYAVSLLVAAPIFIIQLLQSLPAEAAAGNFGLHTLTHGTLIQAWIPAWSFAWNGPAWSLSVEAFFYLGFPLLMLGLSSRGRAWALGLFVVAGGFAVALRKVAPSFDIVGAAQKHLGWANPLLWLPLFLVGICAGERYLRRERASKPEPPRDNWSSVPGLALAILIVVLMAANLQRLSQLLYCYALTPFCALLVYFTARDRSWLARLLSSKILVLLGEASYSLYILHRPVHDWFAWGRLRSLLPSTETPTGFGLYLTTCLVLSVLSLRIIENPCRRWMTNRLGLRRPPISTEQKLSGIYEPVLTR